MGIKLKKKNFAKSTLASGITAGATQLTVATGGGAKFPSNGKFRAVLWGSAYNNPSDDPDAEIVEAELNTGDTFNITRGKEGTSGHSWNASDNFTHTITAETLEEVGQVVQTVHFQTGEVATGTTTIPDDDTIPQNTEGDEYMTATITPENASNNLVIEVIANVAHSVTAYLIMALFQDAGVEALATVQDMNHANNMITQLVLRHEMVAGTASTTTFKVRIGGNNSGTTTLNGRVGTRRFGGKMASSIRIIEYKA